MNMIFASVNTAVLQAKMVINTEYNLINSMMHLYIFQLSVNNG